MSNKVDKSLGEEQKRHNYRYRSIVSKCEGLFFTLPSSFRTALGIVAVFGIGWFLENLDDFLKSFISILNEANSTDFTCVDRQNFILRFSLYLVIRTMPLVSIVFSVTRYIILPGLGAVITVAIIRSWSKTHRPRALKRRGEDGVQLDIFFTAFTGTMVAFVALLTLLLFVVLASQFIHAIPCATIPQSFKGDTLL